jgi:hypothetical protein
MPYRKSKYHGNKSQNTKLNILLFCFRYIRNRNTKVRSSQNNKSIVALFYFRFIGNLIRRKEHLEVFGSNKIGNGYWIPKSVVFVELL